MKLLDLMLNWKGNTVSWIITFLIWLVSLTQPAPNVTPMNAVPPICNGEPEPPVAWLPPDAPGTDTDWDGIDSENDKNIHVVVIYAQYFQGWGISWDRQ